MHEFKCNKYQYMKLNTIVVDDSSIQRITIAKLISEHPNLNLGGDFSNALEAKNYITNNILTFSRLSNKHK